MNEVHVITNGELLGATAKSALATIKATDSLGGNRLVAGAVGGYAGLLSKLLGADPTNAEAVASLVTLGVTDAMKR